MCPNSGVVVQGCPTVWVKHGDEKAYDPATPLLGIYLEKTLIQKDTSTPMFIAALFTIAKTWKQPKCPSTDEWMVVCVYIYMCVCVCVCVCVYIYIYIHNAILFSHKKEWNIAICRNMDACRVYHTEWSKSDRERQILYDITYMWNLKKIVLIYKTETDSQT